MSIRLELLGKRFGYLIVKRYSHTNKHRNAIWECLCDCGKTTFLRSAVLRNGHTRSCGCLRRDLVSRRNKKHGLCSERIYRIWQDMKKRCYDKNWRQYKDWGGRGIKVCGEWRDDFISFYNWAIANGYKDNLTIERIDNDGNYEPDNCTFIEFKKQSKNRRNVHLLTFRNKTMCLSEWAKRLKVPYERIRRRYAQGWSARDIILKPKQVN